MTAGLVAYFLGTIHHQNAINTLSWMITAPPEGVSWPLAVRAHLKQLSHQLRDASDVNNPFVIYNGEIPLDEYNDPFF